MSDFWSRRKAAVDAEVLAEEQAQAAAAQQAVEAKRAERSDEELLAEAGLPDPDTIEDPDQVKEFLNAALPQRLKTRALRKLWTLNPVLANVDGLVDYGEDFTDAAMCVENMQTAYQVGKGMLKAFIDDETPKPDEAEASDEEVIALEDAQDDTLTDNETDDPAEQDGTTTQSDVVAAATGSDDSNTMPPARRRMRFSFDATQ